MLKIYHKKLNKAERDKTLLIQGDVKKLPVKNNTISNCLVVALFHLLADYQIVIDEIQRALRHSGTMILPGLELITTTGSAIDKAWEMYYQLLEENHVTGIKSKGPSKKHLIQFLKTKFIVNEIHLKSLIVEESYPMTRLFYEIENQTDSNIVNIDKDLNQAVMITLKEQLAAKYGSMFLELTQVYKSYVSITLVTMP